MKRHKLRLDLNLETIRTLAGSQLTTVAGGLPRATEADVECPATMGVPTCDGNTCVSRCASDCYTCGRTCREDCL